MPARSQTAKTTATRASKPRKAAAKTAKSSTNGSNGRVTPAKRAAAISVKQSAGSGSTHALVASGRRINLSAKRLAPIKTKDWQDECWLYFDEVTEIKESIWYLGNQMAKLMLYVGLGDARGDVVDVNDPAVLNPQDGTQPVIPASVAAAAADALAGVQCLDGGQGELLRRIEMNLEVPGELYLVGFAERPAGSPGYPEGEPADWKVCSTDEVELKGRSYIVKTDSSDTKGRPIEEDLGDVMIRVWLSHPRWASQPDSLLRGCLPDCRLLSAIVGQQLAEAYSKLNAGFFTWPKELNPKQNITAEPNGDGEPKTNPTLEKLIDQAVGPIEDPSHPAVATPAFIEGQAEYLKPDVLRHISIARPHDPTIDDRKEKSIERVARGMNLPVEKVMGHEETTFANAAQVDEDEFDDYLKPRADMLTTILTTLVMRPIWRALPEVGEQWADRLVVAGDPSAMIASPNIEDNADGAFDRNTISAATYRKVKGYAEEDAPTDDEILARVGQRRGILTADISKALLEQGMGVTIDVTPLPVADTTGSGSQAASDQAVAAHIITQITAAARKPTENVGRQLQQIDYELRVRVLVAADMALGRALEKAGNRLRSKLTASAKREFRTVASRRLASMLGPSLVADIAGGEDLFAGAWDDLERSFKTWAGEAGSQAIDVAGRVTSGFSIAERETLQLRQAESVNEAWTWLKGSLQATGEAKLFNPDPNIPVTQIGESLSADVPPGMIRQAISRAGGTTGLVTQDGGTWIALADGGTRPAGGIGTGELIRDVLRDNGAGIEGYAWVYGPALRKTPFLPHQELDGVTFQNFDDDVLANTSGWPEVDFYFPGDHGGCVCDFEPIIIPASENVAALADETQLDVVPPMVVNDLGPMPTGLKTSKAIEDEFAKRWGDGGDRLTSLKWMTRDSAESVAVRLDKMMTLHPQTAESIIGVGKPGAEMKAIGHGRPVRGAIAVAEGRFALAAGRTTGEVSTAIKFTPKYFTKAGEDVLIEQYETGSATKFFAPGGSEDPAAYIVTHEFGHAIDYKATANAVKQGLSERAYTNELDAVVERHLGPARERAVTGKTMESVLSRYGGTNRAEMIAESVAEYHMSPNPRQFAREIYEVVFRWAEGAELPGPLNLGAE